MASAIALPTAILVGSAVSTAAGLGSAYASYKSAEKTAASNLEAQESANATNVQMTQDTNAQNYQIWREQSNQQWQMWKAQNEYNTPVNQARRLSAAGINPNLALSGSNSGNAGSVSTPAAPQMVAPQVVAPQMAQFEPAIAKVLQTLSNTPDQVLGLLDKLALTQQHQTQSAVDFATSHTKIQSAYVNLFKEVQDSSKSSAERLMAWNNLKYLDSFNQARNQNLVNQNQLQRAQYLSSVVSTVKTMADTEAIQLQNEFRRMSIPVELKQLQATLENTLGSTATMAVQRRLTDAQIGQVAADTFRTQAQTAGIRLSNLQFARLDPYIRKSTISAIKTQLGTDALEQQYQQKLSNPSLRRIRNAARFTIETLPGLSTISNLFGHAK